MASHIISALMFMISVLGHEPIKAGMVFTVEPGIYIEQEKTGVRIENNFWITRNGNKDLMKNIPITAREIEATHESSVNYFNLVFRMLKPGNLTLIFDNR